MRFLAFALVFSFLSVSAETINLSAGGSIQEAIDLAQDGDQIVLAAGQYDGSINYSGKAITIMGAGRSTVINGNNEGPTVVFNSGELNTSVIKSVRLRRARGNEAIRVENSSPIIENCFIERNRSNTPASGIYFVGQAQGEVAIARNNVLALNRALNRSNDPHQIHIVNASPLIANNTIVRGDSNGIFVRAGSSPIIVNNILAFNGSRGRGRGICMVGLNDSDQPDINYNIFFGNRKGDIFLNGTDYEDVEEAQEQTFEEFTLSENIHSNPRFRRIRRARNLTLRNNSPAIDSGNPEESFNDKDGSRNDIGYTGGQNSDFNRITLF
jgi:hypothetical protein